MLNIIQVRFFAPKLILILAFAGMTLLVYKELDSQEKKVTADSSKKSSDSISFSREIQPILTKNCATKDCHMGPRPPKKLDLSEGKAYTGMVNVTSREMPKLKIVAPGNLELSYLYDKLTGNQDEGDRMPSGKKALPKADIELIKKWILAGAQGDSLTALVKDSVVKKDSLQSKAVESKKPEKKIE